MEIHILYMLVYFKFIFIVSCYKCFCGLKCIQLLMVSASILVIRGQLLGMYEHTVSCSLLMFIPVCQHVIEFRIDLR